MKIKTLSRGQVRSLLKLQNGRCAISGKKIHPSMVSIDHIYPVSRSKEFGDKKGFGKYWLVDPDINRMKGSLTVEELRIKISMIDNFKQESDKIRKTLLNNDLEEMSKSEFDEYIKSNYDENGVVKD
jgi:hypothetical protein